MNLEWFEWNNCKGRTGGEGCEGSLAESMSKISWKLSGRFGHHDKGRLNFLEEKKLRGGGRAFQLLEYQWREGRFDKKA